MSELPPIKVSELDVDRLEGLLDKKPYRDDKRFDGLRSELARAEVLPVDAMPADVVRMNSTVTFEVEESGKQFHLTLCYPHEINGRTETLSIFAPIGSALLGLSVGQTIDWTLPDAHHRHVRIIQVENSSLS
ncbi:MULTISPECIES: nucleoside diphosphate kinase regulator [Nitrincola]|uniref:Regulator of nucleoside diphosphate kinase n=1 Tax=Nitrincola nitratireducens TaxID=1229521 RepID=W9UWC7_9GAMM|nr:MULTISPECIES: nucleoside diphosphate kinase regulator [Nitrincola]EXJ11354.1 Regulator of nucleoside diphosphate kinase [Nitrincola nitratireducens]